MNSLSANDPSSSETDRLHACRARHKQESQAAAMGPAIQHRQECFLEGGSETCIGEIDIIYNQTQTHNNYEA